MDSEGYIYNFKGNRSNYVSYVCKKNVRSKNRKLSEHNLLAPCPAKVKFYSEEDLFLDGIHNHEG